MINVGIKLDGVKMPKYQTDGACCFDLAAKEPTVLQPKEFTKVPLGVAFDLPKGVHVLIAPRSSLAVKRGLIMGNSIGVIDSDYRGEVSAVLYNVTDEIVCLAAGERIAQGMVIKGVTAEFHEVEELSETERGAGGFGSTGN